MTDMRTYQLYPVVATELVGKQPSRASGQAGLTATSGPPHLHGKLLPISPVGSHWAASRGHGSAAAELVLIRGCTVTGAPLRGARGKGTGSRGAAGDRYDCPRRSSNSGRTYSCFKQKLRAETSPVPPISLSQVVSQTTTCKDPVGCSSAEFFGCVSSARFREQPSHSV